MKAILEALGVDVSTRDTIMPDLVKLARAQRCSLGEVGKWQPFADFVNANDTADENTDAA